MKNTENIFERFGKILNPDTDCMSCGAVINIPDFKDKQSVREYSVLGMCYNCQIEIFNQDNNDINE